MDRQPDYILEVTERLVARERRHALARRAIRRRLRWRPLWWLDIGESVKEKRKRLLIRSAIYLALVYLVLRVFFWDEYCMLAVLVRQVILRLLVHE